MWAPWVPVSVRHLRLHYSAQPTPEKQGELGDSTLTLVLTFLGNPWNLPRDLFLLNILDTFTVTLTLFIFIFFLFLKFRTYWRSLGVCSAMALMSAFCTVSCETLCEFACPSSSGAMLISVFIQGPCWSLYLSSIIGGDTEEDSSCFRRHSSTRPLVTWI